MTLIDRYLSEVERRLPAKEARDLMAELRDDLLSRAEALEDRLGRAASEAETAEMLRAFGHPRTVAARYRGARSLIGPETFPLFVEVARPVIGVLAGVAATVVGLPMLTEGVSAQRVIEVLFAMADVALPAFALLVLIFAAVDQDGGAGADWDPRRLPTVPAGRDRRGDAILDIITGVVVLGWVLGLLPTDWMFRYDGEPLALAPTAAALALKGPVMALAAGLIVVPAAVLLRPDWRLPLTLIYIAVRAACIAMVAIAVQSGPLVATRLPAFKALANNGATVLLWLVALGFAVELGRDVHSLWRARRR